MGRGAAGTLVGIALVTACAAEAPRLDAVPEPDSCPCADRGGACPASTCGLRILVDAATCGGRVAKVEVQIGDTLEPGTWRPGEPRLACRALRVGEELVVRARADSPWMWHSEPLVCDSGRAGGVIDHVLQCRTGR